jgi:hypothetical protein
MLALLLAAQLLPVPDGLQAVGVILHPEPGRCTAVLRVGERTRVAAVGDRVFGGLVTMIREDVVRLDFSSGPVELRLPAAAPTSPVTRPGPPVEANDRAGGEGEPPARAMPRADVEKRLGTEIPRILTETALRPVVEDGRVVGLLVARLPEGTLLSDAGLRAGDVLVEINETAIDGMGTLMGLWPRLQSATEIRAVVRRAGRPVRLSVTLD